MSSQVDGHYEQTITVYIKDMEEYDYITVNFTPTEEQQKSYISLDKTFDEMSEREFEEEMQHREAWVAENLSTLLSNNLINDIIGSHIEDLDDLDDLEQAFEDGRIDPKAAYV